MPTSNKNVFIFLYTGLKNIYLNLVYETIFFVVKKKKVFKYNKKCFWWKK